MKKKLKRLKQYLRFLTAKKIKFNVGSSGINTDLDFYATDIDTLNITKDDDWRNLLMNLRVDNITAEHVWEHLSDVDTILANKNCFKYLKKNGVLRLAVPDGLHPDENYIEYVRPGGSGLGADDHKVLYTYKIMKERLESAGFRVDLLEYWDENGTFHFKDWNSENGYIMRSSKNDKRNKDGVLHYTSLIVDAIKM
ncbi:SAM-dependent methyltransferase [soil metagenome]